MASKNQLVVELRSPEFSTEHVRVYTLRGHERISRLFDFEMIVVASGGTEIDVEAAMGARATIVISENGEKRREIHGLIAGIVDLLDTESDTRSYRVRFVPRAFRLTMVKTQEIFVNQSYKDIIAHKLDLVGLAASETFKLATPYEPRDFVVQYRESDLDFVSRLAEHLGWSFYFDQSSDEDRIVFVDAESGFRPIEGHEKAAFRPRGEHVDIYRLEMATNLVPAAFGIDDYNYLTPRVDLHKLQETPHGYGGGVMEYGTNHRTPEEGALLALVRAEEASARRIVYHGESALPTLAAGARVTITDHPKLGDFELLIVAVEHSFDEREAATGGEKAHYHVSFEAIPVGQAYRPPRTTPRPRIPGVMHGIVVPPDGVNTRRPFIDEHGRYLVRLLFDSAPSSKQRASLPVRMAQPHAGAGFGVHMPLRPGTEVLVAFVDGDPDRPVIVGAMPNVETPSPVVDRDSVYHRIQTSSGILLEINDGR